MTDNIKLREIISESGLKLKFIAKSLGLSYYGLQKKIDNESEFKPSEIFTLCKLLRINDLKDKEKIFFKVEN